MNLARSAANNDPLGSIQVPFDELQIRISQG